jgi:AAA+ superfamily predicted ATPase
VIAGAMIADPLLAALERLDRRLAAAVAAAEAAYGHGPGVDPYRGLYVAPADLDRLLAQTPGAPPFTTADAVGPWPDAGEDDHFARLAAALGLGAFELDVVLIALAPELDLRYERLYAYLQDDVTRRRPTVDLTLNLLCPSAADKLGRRACFTPEAPLLRHGLLRVVADAAHPDAPLLARAVVLEPQVVRWLLGRPGLDPRLAAGAELARPALPGGDGPLDPVREAGLVRLVRDARAAGQGLVLVFAGPAGSGKRLAAARLAAATDMSLLTVDLDRLASGVEDPLRTAATAARLHDAVLYLRGGADRETELRPVIAGLHERGGIAVLAGPRPLAGATAVVAFPPSDLAARRRCWRDALASAGLATDAGAVDALTARFRLGPDETAAAVALATGLARARQAAPGLDDLLAGARACATRDLGALARPVSPAHGWSDLVLPEDSLTQLRELCGRVAAGPRVLGEWGFGARPATGRGVTALFAGPSGTGKTMAAQVVAGELGLALYRIDLAGVVSKYIGETEKNLDRVFTATEGGGTILFFDEADALFGRRSEVRDSHDRYANLEISYLLQKMEEYEGVAILATNLRQNLDEAFVRRLAFTVHFPFPDEPSRRRLWAGVWPADTPLGPDVDLALLARRFKLSGGAIRNTALAAAFLAAADGGVVTMAHLLHAVRREEQKLGRAVGWNAGTVEASS